MVIYCLILPLIHFHKTCVPGNPLTQPYPYSYVGKPTNPVTPLCMGNRHHSLHGEEAITSPPPVHQEGAIIIEGGDSVWVSYGVAIG